MSVVLEMIVPSAIQGAGSLLCVRGREEMGLSIRFVPPRESGIHSNDSDEPPIRGMYDGIDGYLD